MFPRGNRRAPDWRIVQRREREQRVEALQAEMQQQEKYSNIASWENKTYKWQFKQNVDRKFAELRKKQKQALVARRRRLAELLNAEDKALKAELKDVFEAPEDRRKRLEEKAMALKNKREEARRKNVQAMYDKQFRATCDAYRELQSLQRTKIAVDGLQAQIDDKVNEEKRLAKADAEFADIWLADMQRKAEREQTEKKERAAANKVTTSVLDEQTAYKRRIIEEEKAKVQAEDQRLLSIWSKEKEDAIQKALVEEREKAANLKKIQQANINRRAVDERKIMVEKARDKYLLEKQLEKEAADIARERAVKQAQRDSSRAYQEQLRLLMIKEKEDMSAMNQIIADAEEERWAKRERQWNAEARAREQLMREVKVTRDLQIEAKKQRKVEEKIQDEAYAQLARQVYNETLAKEEAKKRVVKEQAMRRAKLLEQQIREKKEEKIREKQAAFLDQRRIEREEREYMAKVNKLLREERAVLERKLKK